MTDQPTLFDANRTPYGISFSNHAAVTTPQHELDGFFEQRELRS